MDAQRMSRNRYCAILLGGDGYHAYTRAESAARLMEDIGWGFAIGAFLLAVSLGPRPAVPSTRSLACLAIGALATPLLTKPDVQHIKRH